MADLKKLAYIFGLGMACGYYGLTCLIFVLAFLTGSTSVIIHLNLFGEMSFEFVLTVFSIPFTVYAVKKSIDNERRCGTMRARLEGEAH